MAACLSSKLGENYIRGAMLAAAQRIDKALGKPVHGSRAALSFLADDPKSGIAGQHPNSTCSDLKA